MYGALHGTRLVAVHDEFNIVVKFVNNQSNKEEFNIVKIKKKSKNIPDFSDLYLTRYNDLYVPYCLYDTMKSMSDEYIADYKFCIDILYRLLEENEYLDTKEVKHVTKVISILEKEIDNQEVVGDIKVLEELKDMNDTFKRKVR
mgnify:CR=1 FL=1